MNGKQLYWQDVEVGQDIPGLSWEIDWLQMAKQTSGSQDFNLVHCDPDFARAWGHPAPFMNTGFMQGCFSRLLTDWIGDEGFIHKFHMEMRRSNYVGDTMVIKGKVTKKYIQDNEHYVEADIWAENEREGVTTPSRCTVILPSKG